MMSSNVKTQLKNMIKRAKQIELERKQSTQKAPVLKGQSQISLTLDEILGSDDSSGIDENDDKVVPYEQETEFIRKDSESNAHFLISPTFGDAIKIKGPTMRFGTSKNGFKDLIHIEQ